MTASSSSTARTASPGKPRCANFGNASSDKRDVASASLPGSREVASLRTRLRRLRLRSLRESGVGKGTEAKPALDIAVLFGSVGSLSGGKAKVCSRGESEAARLPAFMNIAFAGTPDFAATILRGLLASHHEVGLVISQPDARRGRGRKTSPPPVAELAREANLPLLQPERASEAADEIANHEALVVAAYGQILRPDTLYTARLDAWNVHASLLPKYRGAAPIERAIMNGEKESGVTIMKMDEGLDTGPVALRKTTPIPPDMNAGELTETLAKLGSQAMVEVLTLLEDAKLNLIEQDSRNATYASKVLSEDQSLDWGRSAVEVHNVVRALSPRIGARAYHDGYEGPIKIWRTRVVEVGSGKLLPGEICVKNGGIVVGCGDGAVEVVELQAPGGRRLGAGEFLRGNEFGGTLRGVG